MDISSFSNERILNTIKQSYNFDAEIVVAAKELALKKGLMSSLEIEKVLAQNEIRREQKKNANYELDKLANMGELDVSKNKWSSWFHLLMPALVILICVAVYLFTGHIVFLLLGPSAGGFMYAKRKSKFER